ncbi:MAG: Gfo/Idh/MocA family oxidoreductase [Candidatus Hydrogenedentota bacterium]
MRFLVAGCGSIGKRHVRNLVQIGIAPADIGVYDPNPDRAREAGQGCGVERQYTDLATALDDGQFGAVLVCAPTAFHTQVGLPAAERGCHLFVEKPIARDATDLEKLLRLTEEKNLVFMVAYLFRFHPGYRLVKEILDAGTIGVVYAARVECGQYLPDWHPHEDYRHFYMSKEAEGGGALLDISHEFDYVRSFMGSRVVEVSGFHDTLGPLEMDADNMSATLLRFENRAIASVHLDLLQRTVRRNCELIGEKGTLIWDHISKTVTVYTPADKKGTVRKYEYDGNQAYIDELNHFRECIAEKKSPLVDGRSGYDTLQIVLAAKSSSREKRVIRFDKE